MKAAGDINIILHIHNTNSYLSAKNPRSQGYIIILHRIYSTVVDMMYYINIYWKPSGLGRKEFLEECAFLQPKRNLRLLNLISCNILQERSLFALSCNNS